MFCAAAGGQNIWKAAAFGALGSGMSYGIGGLFGHAAGGLVSELLRAGAHGISGGGGGSGSGGGSSQYLPNVIVNGNYRPSLVWIDFL